MAGQTVLKVLLRERHMQEYKTFCREYKKVARSIDTSLVEQCPSKATFYRWLAGNLQGLPYPGPCRVLEKMLPGWNAPELFKQWDSPAIPKPSSQVDAPNGQSPDGLLSQIPNSMSVASLAGYWVTYFKFDSIMHHVDISHLVPQSNRLATVTNYQPPPRSEGRTSGFNNAANVELVNRHLIGTWKNTSDSYYFGTMHLAVLPGEAVLEGYYTGFENDISVMTERWRWIRIDPTSLQGVDLEQASLRDPCSLYDHLEQYFNTNVPIKLAEILEGNKSGAH